MRRTKRTASTCCLMQQRLRNVCQRMNVTLMLVMLTVTTAWAQFSGGSGTSTDPYQIGSVSDLVTLRTHVNNGSTNYDGLYFVQTADIDMTNETAWTGGGIGDGESHRFGGHYDGQGYTIKGLSVSSGDYVGLFGYVQGELIQGSLARIMIKNVLLKDGNINGITAGGLVAVGNSVEVTGCSFTGTINSNWTTGGLVGEAVDCSFTDCSFTGSVGGGPGESDNSNGGCGGLVGYSDGSVFTNCTATVNIDWDLNSGFYDGTGRTNSNNFVGEGGAAGVTLGASQFISCSATGTLTAAHGYAGGFVGWTAGEETFDGCTTNVSINPDNSSDDIIGNGGFAACVASNGATFKDCTTSSQGNNICGGFYNVQHPKSGVRVGINTFLRCTVNNVSIDEKMYEAGGFCVSTWNGSFEDCIVRGGEPEAGFVFYAGQMPSSDYADEQTSTFTNCAVIGATVTTGFVMIANPNGSSNNINKFSGCRAACTYNNLCDGSSYDGFAHLLRNATTVEDCVAYGAQVGISDELYGFAYQIDPGATVRRCVGAVLPHPSQTGGAGFAKQVNNDTVVEDCYSVYAPTVAATNERQQGGFVLETKEDYYFSSDIAKFARCFALGVIPESTAEGNGSFCGYDEYNEVLFEDCYRPVESPMDDISNRDHEGINAMTKAEFASATSATMPNYDFDNVWHAPRGISSSPYLNASTNANGDFWFFGSISSGAGRILVNGDEAEEAYPASAVLTIEAICGKGMRFTGWVGEGIADPTAQVTTYTVNNVSAIAATFSEVDFATGILSLVDDKDVMDMTDIWHTLDGRKLGGKPTTKGVYVVNGRKFIIK